MLVKAYALVIMTADKLIGVRARTASGLSIGIKDDSLVLASSCAFDTIRAGCRDVEPGEIVVITMAACIAITQACRYRPGCIFSIYLARPDSVMAGRNVYMAQEKPALRCTEASCRCRY